jgi:hypothetical protein
LELRYAAPPAYRTPVCAAARPLFHRVGFESSPKTTTYHKPPARGACARDRGDPVLSTLAGGWGVVAKGSGSACPTRPAQGPRVRCRTRAGYSRMSHSRDFKRTRARACQGRRARRALFAVGGDTLPEKYLGPSRRPLRRRVRPRDRRKRMGSTSSRTRARQPALAVARAEEQFKVCSSPLGHSPATEVPAPHLR